MNIPAWLLLGALVLGSAVHADGQTRPVDLSMATIEELMNIEITSASRKEQRFDEVPAAVYVITNDDIRRSGMTSIPAVLRLVPGVQVARINSNKWAISVRGFNGLYSNKLVVLVDGRSVYNPLFSGVLWDTEDLMLEDVDRVEVIRGPGAAVWGANAVNGVINILTRPASETTGLLVRAGAGTFDRRQVAIRYGGAAGRRGAYRAYAQVSTYGDTVIAHTPANDHWRSLTSGLRGDWSMGPEAIMLQGSVSDGRERPLWLNLNPAASGVTAAANVSETLVANVLGRWTHARSNGATLQLQSYLDLSHRRESIVEYRRHTVDLDAAYHTGLGRRHDLVVGGGYRDSTDATAASVGFSLVPPRVRQRTVNAFAQDEIALAGPRLRLTLGAKFEHETYAGSDVQPTARIMWNMRSRQHVWVAMSRALRTPSLLDRGVRIELPTSMPGATPDAPRVNVIASVHGNPVLQNERLVSTEAGYRLDIGSRAAIDVAGFFGRYENLQTNESLPPTVIIVGGRPVVSVSTTFQNLLNADTRGLEITGRLALTNAWQVEGTVSTFHLTPQPDPTSTDRVAAVWDGSAPAYQWRAHSALSLGSRAQTDVLLFYVGSLRQLGIPAYTRADARIEWALSPRLSAMVQGQNLFAPSHAEFAGAFLILSTQVPRSGTLRLTWKF